MTAVVHKTNLHSTERNEQLIEDPLRVPIISSTLYAVAVVMKSQKWL